MDVWREQTPPGVDGPCPKCQALPCMCGEAYLTWPLGRVEHLRAILTRVLLQRGETPATRERIFPVDDADKGGL
jgi:hypothetical protein